MSYSLEINRYISLPIFVQIFNHFTIIGYRFCKKKKKKYIYLYIYIFFFFFVTYIIIRSITSSEMCSLHLTHPSAHTPGAVDTHTDTHTHTDTPGAVDTHTHSWSSVHTHTPGASGHTHTQLEQCTHTHTWSQWGHTHTHTHTHGAVDMVHSHCLSIVLCKCIDNLRCHTVDTHSCIRLVFVELLRSFEVSKK